jgi:peptidoglycan/LPS O-acetylase OafA/YrhL
MALFQQPAAVTPAPAPNVSAAGSSAAAARPAALPELDALRGVAVLAVIGLHVSFGFLAAAPPASTAAGWALVAHLLTAYGTPLFVALSMTGLALGYPRPMGFGADHRAFLVRRARRILPAYLFWVVLTVLRNEPATLAHPAAMAQRLLTGSAAYHFYFVPLICEYYLLWPVFSRLAAAARGGRGAALVIAAGGLAASLAIWRAAGAGLISNGPVMLPLFWLGYATLGIAAAPELARRLAERPLPARCWLRLAAIVILTAIIVVRHVATLLGPAPDVATLVIATTIFQAPTMAYTLAAIVLAAVLVGVDGPGTRLLQALGRRSYGVYLAHVLVLEVVLERVFGRPAGADFTSPAWLVEMVAEWVACLALTYAVVLTMERVPALAPFAGSRPTAPIAR